MRLVPALALGLMLPLGTAAMIAAPAQAAKKKADANALNPSPEFLKIYQEADKLSKANDFAGLTAKIAEAEQVAKTPDDQYLIGTLLLNSGSAQKDEAQQRAGLEKMLGSGKTAPEEAGKFHFFAGQFAYKAKEYDAAIPHFTAAASANYEPSNSNLLLAEAYFSKAAQNVAGQQLNPQGKQFAQQGLVFLRKAIDAEKAAGKPVPPEWTSRGFRMAQLSGSPDAAQWTGDALKSGGASAGENWRIALRTFQDNHKTMTRDENLDVLRLMAATGALKEAYSYGEYADSAYKAGLPGESKAVIDKGRAAGHLQPTQLAELYKAASAAVSGDRASLASAEAGAAKAPNGKSASATASAYLGYGDNAKAATLYKLALTKGGVDANEVNTRLGIALANSGDTAGAKAAFAAVTGPGNRKDIANFWTSYLDTKSGGAAPAPAAAAPAS